LFHNKLPYTTVIKAITVRLFYKKIEILEFAFPVFPMGSIRLTALGRIELKKQWIRSISYKRQDYCQYDLPWNAIDTLQEIP
jgi:hypothetical protein